jgi:hypothetical protein
MELAIALFLIALGGGLLWLGWRTWQKLMARAEEVEATQQRSGHAVKPSGPVAADGVVCLFAHRFVRPAPKPGAGGRDRAFAPLTEEELDPEDFALQMLYALLAELFSNGFLDFRVVPREPTHMPPFPHKAWELQVRQLQPLPPSPLANAMSVAFEIITGKRRRRRAGADEKAEWVALDDLLDRTLRAVRQELSFWERTGVYGDLRTYVEDALVAQGYLLAPERTTWLDRVRGRRPHRANRQAIEELTAEAEALRQRLAEFRRRYGSAVAAAVPDEGPMPIQDVEPDLLDPNRSLGDLPLDDCLRLSLYEVLTCLRQLEPSGGAEV